jgi:hypothetical protein
MSAIGTTSKGRRRALLAAAYLAAGLVIVGLGWSLVGRKGPGPGRSREVLLVVSGDTAGWLTPCGCTVNQSGGLPRRGTLIDGLARDHDVLYADVGGIIDGQSPYHALKAGAILRGETLMGLVAQNLGAAELALGPPALRDLAASTGVPFLSANAAPASGDPLPATRIVMAGALRVAFIGVVSPRYADPAWRITEPRAAALAALDTLRGKFDRLIVLAYLNDDELESLARDLPEADAVIGGPTGQTMTPHRVGGASTLVASATRKGKFVLQASLNAGMDARVVELTPTLADAPAQMANVMQFRADLRAHDFAATSTSLARGADRQGALAGSASCQACHQAEAAVWSATAHARAFQSLAAGTQYDPSCQLCHTTGYAAPGGFLTVAASQARVDVGCEDCHGPSAAHVADPKIHTPYLAAAQCLSCHDPENSPAFDYAHYWEKIRHGPAASAPGKETLQ